MFTKLDLKKVFHRIKMYSNSKELTTFCIRYGAYKYKILIESLTNGPATWQRYINNLLFNYLNIFCIVYLDNILIYSDNILDHEL